MEETNNLVKKIKCVCCEEVNLKFDEERTKKCFECLLKNSNEINQLKADFDLLLKILFEIGVIPTPFLPCKDLSFSQ